MALFRKLFYRKPPDGLLEICERVYVFDCCFTTDAMEQENYKGYVGSIVTQLREHYPDTSLLVFNFREGEAQSHMANALGEYDMTIMEYPRQYEGCPLLPMEVIHHFLRSSESWLSLGLQNVLLMHCERGGWPVMAFMLAALLIYRKLYTGELKTLEMVYKQAPRELLNLLSRLNPIPSQLRYLQYVSRRNVGSEWPPLDRALTMDCVIIRMIPDFDGQGGCRPIFRIYGQDPFLVSDRSPKVLFSTPKKSRTVRYYKQAECELVKIDINCHIQGDVVLECISLRDDMEREEMMFRVMFNTAFIRSNILMLNRDEIDIMWDAKDLFPKDFRVEVIFSEMDTGPSIIPVEYSCFEEKDGLPEEAFAKVQEMFSTVDWLSPKGDTAAEVLQHLTVSNTLIEAYSHLQPHVNQGRAALEHGAKSPEILNSPNQSTPTGLGVIISPEQTLVPHGDDSPPSSTSPVHQLSIAKSSSFSPTKQSDSIVQQNNMAKEGFPSTPPSQPTIDADVPGQPLSSPVTLRPLTPTLEDKIGVRREMPSESTSVLKDDTTTQLDISVPSTTPPKSYDENIRNGPSNSECPPVTSSSTAHVGEANFVATFPSPIPTPTTETSSMMEEGKPGLPTSPITPSSDGNAIQDSRGGLSTPPPHLSSPKRDDITLKTPPPPPPPPNFNPTPIKESSASTCGPPPVAPPPPSINLLKEVAPPPTPPVYPPLVSSARMPAPCPPPPPPPPIVPPNERPSVSGRESSPPPVPPPPPPQPVSPLKEHPASGIAPPPPLTPSVRDNSVTRPALRPPPPPPVSPKVGGGPTPPPPPPPPSGQGTGPTNPSSLSPPAPPPSPANYIGSTPKGPPVPSPPPPRSLPGSPPPPSAPPGAKGKSMLSRTVTSRNNQAKKLKPLHWLKLSRAVSGSLWAETQKTGEASKAPEIDISELETLFSASAPNPDEGGRKTGSRASKANKPEKIQLIDHRRAYNCEIMLSKVKIPLPDLLSSVLSLEDSALDVDQVDNLIKFCPTKEEMDLLKGYKGERDNLGKCEQFFMEMMQVPRIESKLRVFSFKIQFRSQVSDLRKSLNIVNSAAEQIRGSSKLKRVMQTILSLGNALNQGTARGSAIGFRLDSLLKLTDTRARNNKMTLMHYLCKVLSDKLPELLDFWQDLSSLEPAVKIQLKYLAEEMQAINKGLEKVVQELSMSENDGPISEQFGKALKEFLSFSEGEVRSLASLYSGVGRNVDALILYFGEDPSRCPFEQVISTLLNFVRMFKKALEENAKQLEFERKKAEKEAAEKQKLNASDTGRLLQSPIKSVK